MEEEAEVAFPQWKDVFTSLEGRGLILVDEVEPSDKDRRQTWPAIFSEHLSLDLPGHSAQVRAHSRLLHHAKEGDELLQVQRALLVLSNRWKLKKESLS